MDDTDKMTTLQDEDESVTLKDQSAHLIQEPAGLMQVVEESVIEICIKNENLVIQKPEGDIDNCEGPQSCLVMESTNNLKQANEMESCIEIMPVQKLFHSDSDKVEDKNDTILKREDKVYKAKTNMESEHSTEIIMEHRGTVSESNSKKELASEVQSILEGLQDEIPESSFKEKQKQSTENKNGNKETVFQVFQVIEMKDTEQQEQIIVDLPSFSDNKLEMKSKKQNSKTKKNHDMTSSIPNVQCSFCAKKFHTDHQKDIHEKYHTEEHPCKCEYCDKRFTTVGGQHRHERKFHTGEKLHKCAFCEKTFATVSAIRRHERVHTDDRPYKCILCKSTFKDSTDLRRHERRHTGEKPFKCKICDRAFTVRSAMNRHQRVHTGAKPFLCDLCGHAFTDRFTLKQHVKAHERGKVYKCGVCNKGFSFRYHLHSHRRECGNNLTIKDVEDKVSASLASDKETASTAILQLTESIVGSQMVYYLNQPTSEINK
ncbi:uncharacterized protein [Antedon mediterranea]|uniref:uncharacterized protein n=1 Tax=Antedon mediterranea TaxID=105859 RepID=UPI003AF74116